MPGYLTGAFSGYDDNPTAPRPGLGAFESFLADYPGPRPGTPEFHAALLAGQHPIRDWFEQQRQARQAARADRRQQRQDGGFGPATGYALGETAAPAMSLAAPMVALGEDERSRRPGSVVASRQYRPAPVIAK